MSLIGLGKSNELLPPRSFFHLRRTIVGKPGQVCDLRSFEGLWWPLSVRGYPSNLPYQGDDRLGLISFDSFPANSSSLLAGGLTDRWHLNFYLYFICLTGQYGI
jgi:hypothetical protein